MFKDRFDAAGQLATALQAYKDNPDVLILAIPRGGLQLGSVLARELHAPLDVVFTKKIGYPGQPEYAIGAVGLTQAFVNPEYAQRPEFKAYIAQEISKIQHLLKERSYQYRGDRPASVLRDKIIIVVDDGVATGSTLLATLALLKKESPRKIIAALPVCASSALTLLKQQADEVVCLQIPTPFYGVGQVYQNFDQVEDQEAMRLLREAQQ